MAHIRYLDDWTREILSQPRSQLNARFRGWGDEVAGSIRTLPFFTPYRQGFRRVDPALLLQLHTHLRGARCEFKVWDGLLHFLEHALPDEVANDLIDRDIAVSMLGHSRQSDAVMWRLAPLVDEALLTMASEIYTWPQHSVQELRQVLAGAPDNWGLFSSLSHARPSSPEKRAAFERAIENHPQRDRFPQATPGDVAWTPEQHAACYKLPRPLSADATSLLIGHVEHPDGLLGVARDPETPLEILHLLRDLPGSKAIRHAARINLREHQGEEVEP